MSETEIELGGEFAFTIITNDSSMCATAEALSGPP